MSANDNSSEWEKTGQASTSHEVAGALNTRRSTAGDTSTGSTPITGGRVDAAAATQGSAGTLPGGVMGDPNENQGGAMGAVAGAGVAEQPDLTEAGGDLQTQERQGVMTGPDPRRDATTAGGTLGSDLGGSVDSSADVVARSGTGDEGGRPEDANTR